MELPNLFTAPLDPDSPVVPGFHTSSARISELLGGTDLNANLCEIPPGNHLCPYHYEYVEEWLIVLAGEAEVRTPEGPRRLQAGEIMAFPAGPTGAHRVSAPADAGAPARVLMFSENPVPSVCVYPDSDKLALFSGPDEDNVRVRRSSPSSRLEYFDGETA